MYYDIIGDVHGNCIVLEKLLAILGYWKKGGGWHHDERQALFVWDFNDPGEKELVTAEETLETCEEYSIDDILNDGCFLDRDEIDLLLDRLRTKKNLILQGPPGTGKTWLAKRLAFALMGQKDDSRIRAVQFHPNLSYEDFVRGWRPTGEGKLSLADGVFMQAIKAAGKDPSAKPTGHWPWSIWHCVAAFVSLDWSRGWVIPGRSG